MPYTIPPVGTEGAPGFFAWASAVRAAIIDLDLRITGLEGGSTFVGAFDEFTTPFRALSLRRCFTAYTGNAIRVRRSSDNAEMDVGFDTDGNLDTAPMMTWVGSNSAYVTVFYDQSGNARNLGQTTTGAQPRIVNAGTLEVNAGKPKIVFDGTDDYLVSNDVGLYTAGAATLISVHGLAADSADTYFGEVGTSNAQSYRLARIGAGSASPVWRGSLTVGGTNPWSLTAGAGDVTFDGSLRHLFTVDTGSQVASYQDQVERLALTSAARTTAPTLVRTSLGAAAYNTPSGFVSGFVQEIIVWGSNQASSRVDISNASKAYWGTP